LELQTPFELMSFRSSEREQGVKVAARLKRGEENLELVGQGNGPIDAFVSALQGAGIGDFTFKSYAEHSLGDGAGSQAASYVAIEREGRTVWGAGVDSSIERASIKAVLSALNRAL
jgi:2-isopropylmalate synthase